MTQVRLKKVDWKMKKRKATLIIRQLHFNNQGLKK